MRITINNIFNNKIDFSTEYGSATGRWMSDEIPHKKQYIVEFGYDGSVEVKNISFYDQKYELKS